MKNEYYTYDDDECISQSRYVEVSDSATVVLDNNEDSRLDSGTVYHGATVFGQSQNFYDHLGQRVVKVDVADGVTTTVIFVYDIFGNMIEELDMDLDPINTYVYLGNQRMAKIGGAVTGEIGCSMSKRVAQGAQANWMVIAVIPLLILLGLKYRKNKYLVGLFVVIGAGAIIIIAMNEAKSTLEYDEAIYYYHNDHLGTPQMMTDYDGDVVWDAAYEPFGKINEFATQTITNNFRFPGQYEDSMTGMYYNHHRYYMPQLGRYNRYDELAISGRFEYEYYQSQYIYAYNLPIIYYDLNGLHCDSSRIEHESNMADMLYDRWLRSLIFPRNSMLNQVVAACNIVGSRSYYGYACNDWAGVLANYINDSGRMHCCAAETYPVLGEAHTRVQLKCRDCYTEDSITRRYDPWARLLIYPLSGC